MHGGASTGPKTPEGRERARLAPTLARTKRLAELAAALVARVHKARALALEGRIPPSYAEGFPGAPLARMHRDQGPRAIVAALLAAEGDGRLRLTFAEVADGAPHLAGRGFLVLVSVAEPEP